MRWAQKEAVTVLQFSHCGSTSWHLIYFPIKQILYLAFNWVISFSDKLQDEGLICHLLWRSSKAKPQKRSTRGFVLWMCFLSAVIVEKHRQVLKLTRRQLARFSCFQKKKDDLFYSRNTLVLKVLRILPYERCHREVKSHQFQRSCGTVKTK